MSDNDIRSNKNESGTGLYGMDFFHIIVTLIHILKGASYIHVKINVINHYARLTTNIPDYLQTHKDFGLYD